MQVYVLHPHVEGLDITGLGCYYTGLLGGSGVCAYMLGWKLIRGRPQGIKRRQLAHRVWQNMTDCRVISSGVGRQPSPAAVLVDGGCEALACAQAGTWVSAYKWCTDLQSPARMGSFSCTAGL